MTNRTKTTALALAGGVALASGAYALGSQAGDGGATAADPAAPPTAADSAAPPPGPGLGWGGRFGLPALADRLGVDQRKLQAALDDVRTSHAPPDAGGPERLVKDLASALDLPESKVRASLERLRARLGAGRDDRRAAFARALARQLGLDAAKVESALRRLRPGGPPGPGARRPPSLDALADALGVKPDRLRSALGKLRREREPRGFHGRPSHGPFAGGPFVDDLARELGVGPAKVRAALEKLRAKHESDWKLRRDRFAGALASRLGLPASRVKDALGSLPRPGWRERHRF
jgi:hypothetical protein